MLKRIIKSWKRLLLYNKYYKRTGLYKFVIKNVLKVTVIIILLLVLFYIIERYIVDFDDLFKGFIGKLKWQFVLIVFFISETFFGLIPPDLFIIWAKKFENLYLMVTYLALISYVGGFLAFLLGKVIRKVPIIKSFVKNKFEDSFITIKKWGAIIIVFSALFPLPFSTISMVAGIMGFPLNNYLFFALARFPRFYLYAVFIFIFFK